MSIQLLLVVCGIAVGTVVTIITGYTIWRIYRISNPSSDSVSSLREQRIQHAHTLLSRWSLFDYALLVLILFGLTVMLADLVGVIGQPENFPPYHGTYLLFAFIFILFGLLLMVVRLIAVLKSSRTERPAAQHHRHEPNETHQAE